MNEINVPQFSYYNQKGELVVKKGYSVHIEEDPYMANLMGQYSEGNFSSEVENVNKDVASVDNTGYESLSEAIAAAKENSIVKVLSNIVLEESIIVTGAITLDLNGKTIIGTDNAKASFSLFNNKGNLTIKGRGAIKLTAINNRGWNAYSSVISNNPGGKLIVLGGTIEHLGGTDMAYGIDNLTNGKGTYAETIIYGGTIKSTYRAIRQFLNGIAAQNILTVNGGTIQGSNKSIWMQDPSKNANTGKLTVSDKAALKGDVYLFVTSGSTTWPVEVSISNSSLKNKSTVITGNVPPQYSVKNVNGIWSIFNVANSVDSLKALISEKKEAKISIMEDLTISEAFDIPKDSNIELDLVGHVITVTKSNFTNSGSLIIKNGIVTGVDTKEGRRAIINNETGNLSLINTTVKQIYAEGGAAIINSGTMTIDSSDVEAANMAISNKNGAKAVINNGTFIGNGSGLSYAICNQFGSEMIINGGQFTGGHGCIANTEGSTMTINAGSFEVTGNNSYYVLYCSAQGSGQPAKIEFKTSDVILRPDGARKCIYCDNDGSTIIEF